MLILSRKTNESIVIDGRIIVKIVRVEGDVVENWRGSTGGCPGPPAGLFTRDPTNNKEALTQGRSRLPRLPEAKPKKPLKGTQSGNAGLS